MASRYVQSTGRGAAFEVGKQRFGEGNARFRGLSAPKVVREGAIAALTTFVGSRAPGLQGSRGPRGASGPQPTR
jgi:hypothetical protein